MKIEFTPACDACGVEGLDEDETLCGLCKAQRHEAEAEDREAARAKLSRIRRQLADEGSKRYAEARLGAIDHGAVLRDIAASKPGGAK